MKGRHSELNDWLIKAVKNAIKTNTDECIYWPFRCDRDGYGRLRPLHASSRITVGAHRLAFKLAYGRWPTPCALHTCDHPSCINPHHLWEGTTVDNNADRHAKGRSLRGVMQHDAKLTDDLVRKARKEYRPFKMGYHRLAKKYGVSKHAMRLAISGRSWRHVK